VARSEDVVWADRKNGGEALVAAVGSSAFDAADHFGWVACDNRTTRAVAKIFREEYKIPRKSIKAQAYWWRDGQRIANLFRARQSPSSGGRGRIG
jgi:NADPH-dependent ferric siderophore reductase